MDRILVKRYRPDDEAFRRELTFAEEDRHRFTSAPWSGGYRWFKTNVTPIEHYKRPSIDMTAPNKRAG
jgi:hypothetical protein